MYRNWLQTIPRKHSSSATWWRESGPAYRQFSLFRGESEGRKFGSLLSAVSVWPAEGGVDAGGEAGGLEGGVGRESPVTELSLANG